jgi:hypothetical protein
MSVTPEQLAFIEEQVWFCGAMPMRDGVYYVVRRLVQRRTPAPPLADDGDHAAQAIPPVEAAVN